MGILDEGGDMKKWEGTIHNEDRTVIFFFLRTLNKLRLCKNWDISGGMGKEATRFIIRT